MSNITLPGGGSSPPPTSDAIQFIQGNTGGSVGPNLTTFILNFTGDTAQGVSIAGNSGTNSEVVTVANATTSTKGVAQYDPLDFTVVAGVVSLSGTSPNAYTNVTAAMSPYVVTANDYYLSVDASAGPVTIQLPNTPTNNRQFIVKDRLGQALTNNITITTVGGLATIDQAATYVFNDNFESLEMFAQNNNYEVF